MNTNKFILIGGGGHCKACIDIIEQVGKYEIYGILDKEDLIGRETFGYKIIGTDALIPSLVKDDYSFLITLGQIKTATIRERIFNELIRLNANIVTIISPKAYVSKHANIGKGTIVMHNVVINADAIIGYNNIINTGAIIEHDVTIGNHCHISTNAVVNGTCAIGDRVFVGSNTTLMNNISVSENVVIGAASLINKNINEAGLYIGNPAKKYESK